MQQTNQVKKIIDYLEGKIASLKEKLNRYDSPMMQEICKTSPHLQMDYIRLTTELQANEDNLLAIQKFAEPENNKSNDGSGKKKKDGQN